MKKVGINCSVVLLLSIFTFFLVACGGGGGGISAAQGGNNASSKGGRGSGSGEVTVYVNGTPVGGSSADASSGAGAENASTADYSEGVMSLNWTTMSLKLWVNGQLYFNQTLNKGDQFSISGLKLGDNVRAEAVLNTTGGDTLITGEIPSVQDGSALAMYLAYKYECYDETGNLKQSGTYTAETGAVLPTIQCLDGRTVLGWLNTTTGLSTYDKVWKTIPAGTTGNLTFEINDTRSYSGTQLFEVSGTTITGLTAAGQALRVVNVPEGVTAISGSNVFYDSSAVSVSLPSTLTAIPDSAFADLYNLTTVSISSSSNITSIGSSAFSGCTSLSSITIPGSVTTIGSSAFNGCTSLSSISIPGSVGTIGSSAFKSCRNLTTVTIAQGVTVIDGSAFEDCEELRSISIPSSVTSIGNKAFQGCGELASVSFSAGSQLTSLGTYSFYGTKITSIAIPSGVTSIPAYCFDRCEYLTSVSIPSTVTEIGIEAFYFCSRLASIEIPSSVTEIGNRAFSYCGTSATPNTTFTATMISVSPCTIGVSVFQNCADYKIIVPSIAFGLYQSQWSAYSSKIERD